VGILDSLTKTLGGIFGEKGEAATIGIDIGSSSIKVVQISKQNGRAVLDTYGALALGQYEESGVVGQVTNLPAATLAKALADTLRETNTTSKTVVLGIPSVSCIIFIIQLPAEIDEKELATVVPNESKKVIPIPLEDVSLDWYLIPRREDSGVESRVVSESGGAPQISVLVVATLNETLVKYTDTMKQAALSVHSLEIEVFSNIRSCMTRELFPVMIIDLGASKTKLSIVEHGIIETFRLENRGSNDMTLAISHSFQIPFAKAEMLKKDNGLIPTPEHPQLPDLIKAQLIGVFQEASATILAYEKRYNKNIGKIILTGGGAMLRGLPDYAREHFAAEITVADPFSKVEAPQFLGGVLKATGPEFSIAIGLALKNMHGE
jgi:type IV pilus assembly protein PilM